MQKDATLVELEKSCRTHIFLQNFVLIQPRTSPVKFACRRAANPGAYATMPAAATWARPLASASRDAGRVLCLLGAVAEILSRRVVASFWQNFGKMLFVFGCIGTDFCKKICVLQHFQNLPDDQAEIFEIWQDFANFATIAECLLNFHKNCRFLKPIFLRKF